MFAACWCHTAIMVYVHGGGIRLTLSCGIVIW